MPQLFRERSVPFWITSKQVKVQNLLAERMMLLITEVMIH
jgi:hypothetical protein